MTNVPAKATTSLRMPLLIATACLIGTACWVLALGDSLPGKPKLADKPVPAENVMDFAALYATNCAGCHGADGKSGPAPPLNDPLFRAIVPRDVLQQVVSAGRPGTPMPGFSHAHGGNLTAAQIQVLVDCIKAVADPNRTAPAWGIVETAGSDVPPYLASDRQIARTSKAYESIRTTLFARACADCHGDHGEGTDSAGAIDNSEFLALASDQFLRRLIITGLPDLGMPNYKSSDQRDSEFMPLTSAQIDDLVALLGRWRQGKSADVK
jgi:cytochrome c oxidase cbb3-type subunit III